MIFHYFVDLIYALFEILLKEIAVKIWLTCMLGWNFKLYLCDTVKTKKRFGCSFYDKNSNVKATNSILISGKTAVQWRLVILMSKLVYSSAFLSEYGTNTYFCVEPIIYWNAHFISPQASLSYHLP